MRLLAHLLFLITLFLFCMMPFWILISSFFTFMVGLFLVPLYIPLWIVLRSCCRFLLKAFQDNDATDIKSIQRLERAIRLNTRALKYNIWLSIPVLFLFLGYMHGRGKI